MSIKNIINNAYSIPKTRLWILASSIATIDWKLKPKKPEPLDIQLASGLVSSHKSPMHLGRKVLMLSLVLLGLGLLSLAENEKAMSNISVLDETNDVEVDEISEY